MLENKAQNSSGKPALRSTKFHALSRVTEEGYKQLNRLPDSIGNIYTLRSLDLTGNKLTKLPDSIGNLVKLDTLDVTDNWLTSIPENIGNLTRLIRLSFENNHLTYLPESIGNLTNLAYLYLETNSLTYLPESIGNLNNLIWLHLGCNSISHLPVSFGNFCNLVDLGLESNNLSSLPKSIIDLFELNIISLDANLIVNLSILQSLPKLKEVIFLNLEIPYRYWIKLSDWNPKWLLDEKNTEIRRLLIQRKDSGLESLSAIEHRYTFEAILLNILQIIFSITEPQTL